MIDPSPTMGASSGGTPYVPVEQLPYLDLQALRFLKGRVETLRSDRLETDEFYAVTMAPADGAIKRSDDEHRLWRLLSDWSRAMDAGRLGFPRQRLSRLKHIRPRYLLLAQEGATTWHVHGVASVPRRHVEQFEASALPLWHSMTRGSMDIQPCPDHGWLGYITRDIRCDLPFLYCEIPEVATSTTASIPN